MSELSYTRLTPEEVQAALAGCPEWAVTDGLLTRSLSFGSYLEGVAFAAAVGWLAEGLNHHPDLHLGYQQLRIELSTHDAGGLTAYDFELARKIDQLVK